LNIQSEATLFGVTLDVGLQNLLLLGVAILVALPAMSMWTAVSRRSGSWRTLRICCLTSAGSLLLFFFPSSFYGGLAATAIFGLSFAGLLMLTDLLIADMVDADELQTGARREGLYFGMNGFIIRFAFTIQGLITAIILTTTGYVAPTDAILYPAQPAAVVMGFRSMIAGIPTLALVIAFFLLSGYKLHGEQLESVQAEVRALHARKHEALEAKRGDHLIKQSRNITEGFYV